MKSFALVKVKYKKVLFLALAGIGNYLMQMPTIAALKKVHPSWQITVWVAPRGTRILAENDPNVSEVIEAPHKNSLVGHLRMLWLLRGERFDSGIVLSPGQLVKSATYLYLAGIPRRIGNTYPFRNNSQSSFLLNHAIVEDQKLHDIEQNLRLLRPFAINYDRHTATYNLFIPQQNLQEADSIFKKFYIPTDRTPVGIHAGSAPQFTWKRWPLENFALVAKKLIVKHNVHVLLFGGPDEEEQKQELKKRIEDSLRADNNTIQAVSIVSGPLLTTAALTKYCVFLISNDSGVMHLASSSGAKVYALFGPTDENKVGPKGAHSIVIRAPRTQPVYDTEKNYWLGDKPHPTILAITPEQVFAAIQEHEGWLMT